MHQAGLGQGQGDDSGLGSKMAMFYSLVASAQQWQSLGTPVGCDSSLEAQYSHSICLEVYLACDHWQLWLPLRTPALRRPRGWGTATEEGSLPSPRVSEVCGQPSTALKPE